MKYGNKKIVIDGIKFDSQLEGRFYTFFRDNNIRIVDLQPRYVLQPSFKYDGKTIRAIEYIADFIIEYQGGLFVVDAKGMQTTDFKIKRKLWIFKYGHSETLIVAKSIKELLSLIN